MGVNGAGKSHPAEAHRRRATAGRPGRRGGRRAASSSATSPSTPWNSSTRPRRVWDMLVGKFPNAVVGLAEDAARACFGFSGTRRRKSPARVLSAGEKARVVLRADALRSAELPGARRAHQPSRHGHQGDAGGGPARLRGHAALRLARSRTSCASSRTACSRSATDGVRAFGGGYTEYVAQTGYEAPGVHA